MYNLLLDDSQRKVYSEEVSKLYKQLPLLANKKISGSVVQHAFTYKYIIDNFTKEQSLFCVGSYEDVCFELLKEEGYNVTGIDPVTDIDLNTFLSTNTEKFDCVFSVSVIEHVPQDKEFFDSCCSLLKEGGAVVMTMDYNDENPDVPFNENCRFYTPDKIQALLKNSGVTLVDEPTWELGIHDFKYRNIAYSFATLVGVKDEVST